MTETSGVDFTCTPLIPSTDKVKVLVCGDHLFGEGRTGYFAFLFVSGLCSVYHGSFVLPLGASGRLFLRLWIFLDSLRTIL